MQKVAALVPLKLKSRRLPNKNFLRLGDRPLSYHVFDALVNVPHLSKVLCYTSQPQVLSLLPNSVELLMRPRRLDGDNVKANELFRFAVEQIDADIIVLCHATGPYIKKESIVKGVEAVSGGEYDCAFAVQKHQTYAWYNQEPLNYNPEDMSQTQDLTPVYTETSGFYVFRKSDYLEKNTRISGRPFLVEVDFKESVDIDEPKDFSLATLLHDYDPQSQNFSTDDFFINLANEDVPFKNIKHISFDMDGVLIDSLPVMERAWQKAMDATGQEIAFTEYKQHIGIPFYDILSNVGCNRSMFSKVKKVYDESSSLELDRIEVFEGILEALRQAKKAGLLISVVTSKTKQRTTDILEHHFSDIDFDFVVSPEDVPSGRGKPNPDPLLLACIQLGVDPYNTIYVGDMESDRETAQRAGAHFVHAAWGFADLKDVKEMWFNKIEDMMEYILAE
ncbi:HAD-IA family hydrolase [Salinicola acroporae]|uniref:N-acylneuraminate cytidylyltransferase n=1 Tax=Salinicola acroporae TaxID=1541440 RepID=A0ABT6I6J4_9GAMM|nr:HAD-IA family hydrolase [Salinicola acroporae]MDH4572900.1 hypothetical protein [Salinicola acroporae]